MDDPSGVSGSADAHKPTGTLASSVYQQLRTDILKGRFEPGSKLRLQHLAQQYSVGNSPLLAQGASGTISGTVTDTTGAVLPGVEVTITNVGTAQTRLAITGDEGRYSTPQLSSGDYEVRAELAGFQAGVRRGIQLVVGQNAIVNISLQVGSITEEVVVKRERPLLVYEKESA